MKYKKAEWGNEKPSIKEGVLVGLDAKMEWLLPWWWSNYSKHNRFPVAFADFGMTEKAKQFCSERGKVISLELPQNFISSKEKVCEKRAKKWEAIYGSRLWQARSSWFKKPFAMLQTPFQRTIWLDLDCEVLANLSPLFPLCESGADVILAKETESAILHESKQQQLLEGEILYNSGVIIYKHRADLIGKWAEECVKRNKEFLGDEQLLSRIIFSDNFSIEQLSEIYNWRMSQGLNVHAVIIHWAGSWGKDYIRRFGGLSHELKKFRQGL